ncbi:hypothetical protein [Microbulbifer sp. GL-2]|uniref:hypothetical protein n=1 Tax=Microbulbifer sp. GL-2 TaxID=2591606 RepID=UPI001164AD7B|nr:hypothetical protein [Microbulbifer sp. GL-2]BBM02991.1 hypothetical protein GL2_30650 [Microbulbifer sp. GL-2]
MVTIIVIITRIFVSLLFLVFSLGVAGFSGEGENKSGIAEYQVVNLADDFYELYKSSEAMKEDRRVSFIAKSLVEKFPAFYRDKEGVNESDEHSLLNRISFAVKDFPGIEEEYRSRERLLGQKLNENLQYFRRVFFDMEVDVPIYILHSFNEFNGTVRKVDGKSHLMFGVDLMAKYHSWENDSPFFHHELFHVYHENYFEQCEPLWCDIWSEGLATYVAYKLNSNPSYDELMLNIPEDMVPDVERQLAFALKDLKDKFYSTEPDVNSALTSFSSDETGLPSRRGYYLGYLLAKSLGGKYSEIELAKMNAKQVEGILFEELNRMIDKNSG